MRIKNAGGERQGNGSEEGMKGAISTTREGIGDRRHGRI